MLTSYFLNATLNKNSIFLLFTFSYYITLLVLVSFFFLLRIKNLKFLTEISFLTNNSWLNFFIVSVIISFAGLPPFVFFFVKLQVLAVICVKSSFGLALLAVTLIFFGWFIYLNAAKACSVQVWSSGSQSSASTSLNTTVAQLIVTLYVFIFFGFFFASDLLLYFSWIVF